MYIYHSCGIFLVCYVGFNINHTVINRVVMNDLAVFVVAEEILDSKSVTAVVLATNVYRKFDSGWLMIGHHASLVQNRPQGQSLQ